MRAAAGGALLPQDSYPVPLLFQDFAFELQTAGADRSLSSRGGMTTAP